MSYHVLPLQKSNAELFTDFLGNIEFNHAPEWSTCYCRFYHTSCDQDEWMMRSGDTNKRDAIEAIKEGSMQGFLAFDGDTCIGWLNANDANALERLQNQMAPMIRDKKVGCTICYVIHPEYRNQGVARLLLKEAIEHFKTLGYDAMLALPISGGNAQRHYRGSVNMYTENGYQTIEKHDQSSIMWLDLK